MKTEHVKEEGLFCLTDGGVQFLTAGIEWWQEVTAGYIGSAGSKPRLTVTKQKFTIECGYKLKPQCQLI